MCDDICASVTTSKRLQTFGEKAASVLWHRGGFYLCGGAEFVQFVRGDVLSMEPFDADAAGEQGHGAEIGRVLQLSEPGAGDIGCYVKETLLTGLVGQQ